MKRKVISVILILLLSITLLQSNIYATGTPASTSTPTSTGAPQTGGSGFDWNSKKTEMMTKEGDKAVTDPINKIAGTAITVTQVISIGVAIIMLIVLAMKYMSSAPGDRAEIKKHAVPFVVGAFVLFGASGILTLIQEISKAFN